MLGEEEFDVVVVGAGLAGLACAGELVLRGARPLLIAETAEVGSALRSTWVGENRGILQHPMWQVMWGGGWWHDLARRLNIPLRMFISPTMEVTMRGSGVFTDIPYCATPAALTQFMIDMSPLPLDQIREPFGRLAETAFAIPYQELLKMHDVPIIDWLEKNDSDDLTTFIVMSFLATLNALPLEEAKARMSVLGGWGTLRTWVCGEALMMVIYPDARDGLCVPIAQEVERRGGVVWRGERVAQVLVEDDTARGVVLQDGREARAPAVAIATGLTRVGALFEKMPVEVEAPVAYAEACNTNRSFNTYTLLSKPVVPEEHRRLTSIMNPDGSVLQWHVPIHVFPWTTQPGKHFVLATRMHEDAAVEKVSEKGIFAEMDDVCEEIYPGFKDAKEDVVIKTLKHGWEVSTSCGPKLPRVSPSIRNLWYVGEGSVPLGGLWTEGAAGGGILGARGIHGSHR